MEPTLSLTANGSCASMEIRPSDELAQKAKAFARMEEAIAFERACASMELLASCLADNPWVKELSLRWRPSATPGVFGAYGLKITPLGAEGDTALLQNGASLANIIDFAIVSERLAKGTLSEHDASFVRSIPEAMRPAFILGARGEGFNAASAHDVRAKLLLADSELGKALTWAARSESSWLPSALLRSNLEKKATRAQMGSAKDLAEAMGFAALGAELERREIAASAPAARASAPRRPL